MLHNEVIPERILKINYLRNRLNQVCMIFLFICMCMHICTKFSAAMLVTHWFTNTTRINYCKYECLQNFGIFKKTKNKVFRPTTYTQKYIEMCNLIFW